MTPMPVGFLDLLGWAASALVLATFSLKTMVPLRAVAIASNVAFLSYGIAGHLIPIAVLHGTLLPINVFRLVQLRALVARTRQAARADNAGFPWENLAHLLETANFSKGTMLISKGDMADRLYILLDGTVSIAGTDISIGRGEIVGEFGLFSPDRVRTASVKCETDVKVGVLAEGKIWELFFQNPEFGTYLVKTIVARALPKAQ